MKRTKQILLILFSVILISIAGKTFLPFHFAGLILFGGMVCYIVGAILYIILALKNKVHRIEAGMIATSLPLVIGVMFTSMRWPFGGPLIVVGSSSLLMVSIGLLIYLLTQKRKMELGILFFATGFSSLFFCFKIMFWPGASQLFIPAGTCILIALTIISLNKTKLVPAIIVLLLINGLVSATFFTSQSKLYRYKYLNTINPEVNFPENYHIYAWYLYKEGKLEEARINIEMAIQQLKDPNNRHAYDVLESPETGIQRYKRAMDLLESNNWSEIERPINYPY